jgi:hypothetical protein
MSKVAYVMVIVEVVSAFTRAGNWNDVLNAGARRRGLNRVASLRLPKVRARWVHHAEGRQARSVTGPQISNREAGVIGHPDIGPPKATPTGLLPTGKTSLE